VKPNYNFINIYLRWFIWLRDSLHFTPNYYIRAFFF